MRKLLIAVLITAIAAISCSKDDDDKNQKTFVIVHGAWSAPYAWETVQSQLRARGDRVVIVQLQGHGNDNTPPQTLSINAYRDKVVATIDSLGGNVILVGHSLAGMVVSAVAEKIPSKIDKLVYIAAFLPVNGQSLFDLAFSDSTSELGMSIIPTADSLNLDVVHERITDIFIQDGSAAVQSLVLANYRVEPVIPFTNPAVLTAQNFGSVNKYYIHTLQDHAVTYILQKRMVAATGIKNIYQLNTSHSAFLAKPDSVTAILTQIAQ